MHRPDHSTADPNGISTGVPGYTEGDPTAPVARTVVTDDQMNDVVEGLCQAVEASGVSLVKNDYAQIADVFLRYAETNFREHAGANAETDDLLDVCSTGTLLVSVGRNGQIQTSPDGVFWTARTAAGAFAGDFEGVCHGNSLFVAVGTSAEIQTSPDGTTWTQRTAAGGYASSFQAVTYDGTNYIAVGSTGEIQTSPDGTTWTSRRTSSDGTETIHGIAANADYAIATGTSDLLIVSSDNGVTWSAPTTPPSASGSRSFFGAVVLADGSAWVGADDTDAEVWRSTDDGDTWSEWTYYNSNFAGAVLHDFVETPYGVAGIVTNAGLAGEWDNGTQILFRPRDLATGSGLTDDLSAVPIRVSFVNFHGICRHRNATIIVGNDNRTFHSHRFG